MSWRSAVLVLTLMAAPITFAAEPTSLRFEVRLSPELAKTAPRGRVMVVLGPAAGKDPRKTIGDTGMDAPPVLGGDAAPPAADGLIATLGPTHEIFPIESLAKLKPGKYVAQAVVHTNRDLNFPNAPGDLVGPGVPVEIDPAKGGVVQLLVNNRLPDETVLLPGHNYAPTRTSTIGREKTSNPFMRFEAVEDYLRAMGH